MNALRHPMETLYAGVGEFTIGCTRVGCSGTVSTFVADMAGCSYRSLVLMDKDSLGRAGHDRRARLPELLGPLQHRQSRGSFAAGGLLADAAHGFPGLDRDGNAESDPGTEHGQQDRYIHDGGGTNRLRACSPQHNEWLPIAMRHVSQRVEHEFQNG